MRYFPFLSLLIAATLYSCSTCSQLQQRDQALNASFEVVQARYQSGGLTKEAYIGELRKLQHQEEELFEDVRNCDFKNEQQRNYWYRSRLKFPSRIATELERLEGGA